MGIGTPWKAALLLAAGAIGGVAAVAVASVPDRNGVVHACVELQTGTTLPRPQGANLRVIDGAQTCTTTTPPSGGTPPERALNWNVTGPTGPPGSPGSPGRSVTVVAGNTLTLAGGQVITVGNTPTVTIPAPQIGSRSIATLSLTGGITSDVLGFSFVRKTTGSGGSSGKKVAVHDISITKLTDKSSPKLFLACANGQHFKSATLVVRKAGGNKQVTYTLTDVVVASDQTTGHGVKLIDSFTLNYAKLTVQTGKAHA